MARYLTSDPLTGVPAPWSPFGMFVDPTDRAPLGTPRDAQGRALTWNPGLGDYIGADGVPLHNPRVANTGPAGAGFGAVGMLGIDGKPITSGAPGGLAGAAGAASGVNPFFTVTNAKSAPINATNANVLKGIDSTVASGVKDFTDYFKNLFPAMESSTSAELGKLNSLYDPAGQAATTASQLSDLRAATDRMQKLNQDRALAYSKGVDAASGASAPRPFTSSANMREFLRSTNETNAPLELAFADRTRNYQQADLSNALAAIGQANAQRTALARNKLLPVQAEQANTAANLASLGGASAIDLGQNFYGLGGDASQMGGSSFFVPNYGAPPQSGGFPSIPGVGGGGGGFPSNVPRGTIPGRAQTVTGNGYPFNGGGSGNPVADYAAANGVSMTQAAQILSMPGAYRNQALSNLTGADIPAQNPFVSGSQIPNGMTWDQYYNGGQPPSSPFDYSMMGLP